MSLRISGCKTLKHQYIFIWGGIGVKNRMKKRCMASILALVMMCLLGACGTDKADTKLYQKESKETDSSSTQDNTSEDKSADDSEAGDMTVHFPLEVVHSRYWHRQKPIRMEVIIIR